MTLNELFHPSTWVTHAKPSIWIGVVIVVLSSFIALPTSANHYVELVILGAVGCLIFQARREGRASERKLHGLDV